VVDAYLNIAEQVLLACRRPLRPREILQQAYANELLPWHLYGSRQDKTLHARLSEDIARNREESRFFRTAAGVFFLRKFRHDLNIPSAYADEYLAKPRRKELLRDFSLALDTDLHHLIRTDGASVSISLVLECLLQGQYG
jgi:hypothetical protein